MPLEDTYFSYYNQDDNDSLKPFVKETTRETYACLIKGKESYKMVSPVFRQNLYAGKRPELKPFESPVDLFHDPVAENLDVFPLLNQTQIYHVDLEAGQCLFIPAHWWV